MFARGVTLLEILVVVLIVGLIASLALPTYRQHLVRVHRSEATTGLYAISAAEERFYLRQGHYTAELSGIPPDGHYNFEVAVASDGQSFVATATPTREGGQNSDGECLVFSLDHRGRRAVSGSRETPHCWR